MSTIRFVGRTTPDPPASGAYLTYMKTDGKYYVLNSAGDETILGPPRSDLTPFVVSTDGSTDYSSIQDAIDAAAAVASSTSPQVVFVRPGVYTEDLVLKDLVAVIGTNLESPADFSSTPLVAPTVIGSHIVDSVCTFTQVQGFTFVAPVANTPGLSFASTSDPCTFAAINCYFLSLIAKGDNLVEVIPDLSSSVAYFKNCDFSTRSVNEYALYFDSDQCELRMEGCRLGNATSPENALLFSGSVGSSSAFLIGCTSGGIEVDGANCDLRLDRCTLSETTSTEDLVRITSATATVSARYTSFDASASASYAVSGSGSFTDDGACVYNKVAPIEGTLNAVDFAGKVSYRTVEARTVTVSTSSAVLDQPYPMVLVDTATIGALSTVDLPDATEYPGYVCTVYDSGGDASTYAITVTSTGSSISGGNTISTNGQSFTYQSTGVFWRRIATS